eukprot:scaffold20355_cov31-Tisochrysis_lutea.AAC.2
MERAPLPSSPAATPTATDDRPLCHPLCPRTVLPRHAGSRRSPIPARVLLSRVASGRSSRPSRPIITHLMLQIHNHSLAQIHLTNSTSHT